MTLDSADHVRTGKDGHVLVVTLDSPPHNHVSAGLLKDLADTCEAADSDNNVRAIVLQAEGKNFCAGADFSASPNDEPASAEQIHPLYVQAVRLYSTKKPMIAAVHGAAVGAGLGLALAADFRVASPDARFTANFAKLGFHPGFGISLALPRIVGEQKALLMLLTGRRVKGEEALAWGLADELAPLDELRPAALRLAHEIAENAPLAVVAIKNTLRGGFAEEVRAQLALEFSKQMHLNKTEDFAEGIRAVAARRPGRFVGR